MTNPGSTHRRTIMVPGPLASLLLSRAFIPVCLLLSLLFLGTDAFVLARQLGWIPLTLGARQHTISITGPGVGSTPMPLQAYILGAVQQPGVYALNSGARVRDLVQAAGGLTPDADVTRVDLAAQVADGQEIYVPHIGEVVPMDAGGLVNLNSATAEDMHLALGLSLDVARRIVAYRAAHGSFTAISQLLLVPISRSTYDRIKYLVTV